MIPDKKTNNNQPQQDKQPTQWHELSSKLLMAFGAILVILLNPLGLQQVTEQRSQDAFGRIIAPFYPSTARDNILVVLIDDAALESGNVDWPPTMEQYDTLLTILAGHRPSAVFFDLLLLDPRGDPSDLEFFSDTIDMVHREGVEVYFASPKPLISDTELYPCSRAGPQLLPAISRSAPEQPFVIYQGYGNTFPLYGNDHCTGELLVAPAAMLYRRACQQGLTDCGLSEEITDAALRAKLGDVFSIEWAEGSSSINARLYPHSFKPNNSDELACLADPVSTGEKWKRSFKQILPAMFANLEKQTHLPCLYHPHISAGALMRLPSSFRDELIANKLVLIGANLTGIQDIVESPLHGQLPGVMAHAMMLDNLLVRGSDALKPAGKAFWKLTNADLLEIGILTTFVMLEIAFLYWLRGSKCALVGRPAITFIGLLLGLLLGIGMLLYSYFQLRYPPFNWLGLFTIWMTFLLVLIGEPVKNLVIRSLNHCSQSKEAKRASSDSTTGETPR